GGGVVDERKCWAEGGGWSGAAGRGCARRKLTPDERAKLAAAVASGERTFDPSFAQIAALFHVPVTRLRAALKARAEEVTVEDVAAVQFEAEAVNNQADLIIEAWDFASPTARDAAVRVIGPSAVWGVWSQINT